MLTELSRNRRTSVPKSAKWRRENRLEYSKLAKYVDMISQIFPKTGRISGPEVGDGAKPDVPTTDRQNEKKKKHRPFYEAVDAHARRRLTRNFQQF